MKQGNLKIGIDAHILYDPVAGIRNYLYNLLNEFGHMDSNQQFILFGNSNVLKNYNLDYKNMEINKSFIPTIGSHFISSLNPLWYKFYLPLQLRNRNIDVFFSPNFVLPSLFKGKIVLTIHDLGPIVNPELYARRYRLYFRRIVEQGARKSDKIITGSQNAKNDLVNWLGINNDKIEVVYHGSEERFKEITNRTLINKTLSDYKIQSDYILFVGQISERKNISTLIETYKKLKKEYLIKERLLLVGKLGHNHSKILKLIKKLDLEKDIYIINYVSEDKLPVIYSAAKLFVFPSIFEGFGFPVLEAMACGTPVIAANATSIPEVTGDAGMLFEPKNVNDLTSKIWKVLDNESLRNKLKYRGLNRVKQFTWRRTAKHTLAILEEVNST